MLRQQLPALTGLRFLAALSVVLSHASGKFMPFKGAPPLWYQLIHSGAGIGMSLFFVLSGFVIHYNYSASIESTGLGGVGNFFVARFARLYPLYILGITFDLLNSYSYYQSSPYVGDAVAYYLTMTQTWTYKIFGDRSLIYVFGPLPSVAWSISTEWFFYVAYPLICVTLLSVRRLRSLIWITSLFVFLSLVGFAILYLSQGMISASAVGQYGDVAQDVQYSYFRWLAYFSPYARIFEFLLGCLTASLFMKFDHKPSAREEMIGGFLTTGSIIFTLALFVAMFGNFELPGWLKITHAYRTGFGLAPGLAVLIFCCARYSNETVRLLSGKIPVLCGEASYSLYLLHLVVIERMGLGSPEPINFRIGVGDAMRAIICVLTCIGLSLVTWYLVEVPARRLLRKFMWTRSEKVPATAERATGTA